MFNELGIICYREGKHSKANDLFQESLECLDGKDITDCKLDVGATGISEGNRRVAPGAMGVKGSEYDEGMHTYRSPLSLLNSRSSRHLMVATLRYNMGLTLVQLKDFGKAKQCFLQALDLVSKMPEATVVDSPGSKVDQLKIHHNLGYCNYRNGDPTQAMKCYTQAMLQINAESDSMYDLAVACNCLAMLHLRQCNGNSSDCLDLLRSSLTSFCTAVGNLSPEVATVLFNMGQAHFYRTEYSVALTCFQEALRIRKEHLGGENSIDVAICVFGIGQCFRS